LRLLRELVEEDEYVEELPHVALQVGHGVRQVHRPEAPDPRRAPGHTHEKIVPAVLPFVADSNETARLNAVMALLAQKDTKVVEPLVTQLLDEESVRVKNKICEGLMQLGPRSRKSAATRSRKALPERYVVDGSGALKKG
jgi:HEAT repeat protein